MLLASRKWRGKVIKCHPLKLKYVIGADGSRMTLGDLPPSDQKRWLSRHKANVVFAVRGGLISIEEACRRYKLTGEEFESWERALFRSGIAGLRVTRINHDRT